MPWLRDSMPAQATFQGLKGYLARSHENLDATIANIEARQQLLLLIAEINGVLVNWNFDNSLVIGDPGAGDMRIDSVQLSTVTQIALSRNDIYGRQVLQGRFNVLKAGDTILVGDILRSAWHTFILDSPPALFEAWGRLDVTPGQGNTANPIAGDIMEVKWLPTLE